jgi:hypothetical protein
MKIRINGNTIRLRLSQGEVADISSGKVVSSVCKIGSNSFVYRLETTENPSLFASFVTQTMNVFLPKVYAADWENNDVIGFEHKDETGLTLLVEKDFQCLKPRVSEDESDLFINPMALSTNET